VYRFPSKQQVTESCPHGTDWETHEKVLFWSGFIHNATSCSITTKEIRTLPELRRTDYTRLDTPAWYAPDLMLELTPEEPPRDKEVPGICCCQQHTRDEKPVPVRAKTVSRLHKATYKETISRKLC
jgi:hypothetical protein